MSSHRRMLRSRLSVGTAVILGVLAATCAPFGFVDAGSGPDPRALAVFGLIALLLAGVAIRFLASGVAVTAGGLTVREVARTTRLPWDRLRATDVIAQRAYT